MADPVKMLSSHESAYLAGLSERDMHRAIDENLVPKELVHVGKERRAFTPAVSVLMAFYMGHRDRLTGNERRRVIENTAHRVHREFLDENFSMGLSVSFLTGVSGVEPDDDLKIVTPYIERVRDRLDRLVKARDLVHSTSEVLSGTPVIRGTRIPVHSVAGTYAEEGIKGTLDAYPALDRDTVELAKLYADTHPRRGRPKTRAVPEGTTALRTRRRTLGEIRAGADERS